MGRIFEGKDIWGKRSLTDAEDRVQGERPPDRVIYLGYGYWLEEWSEGMKSLFYDPKMKVLPLSSFANFDETGHPKISPKENKEIEKRMKGFR